MRDRCGMRRMRRWLCRSGSVFALVLVLLAGSAPGAELPPRGALLTLEQCREIAWEHQPELRAGFQNVLAGQARVGQERAARYPQLGAESSYRRSSEVSRASSGAEREVSSEYSHQLGASQLLYDFGRTKARVRRRRLEAESLQADLEDMRERINFAVREAYFVVLKAQRDWQVAVETVRQYEDHLRQAKGFFEAGVKPRFDVTKAEVDLSRARLELITAENAVRLARVRLNNAMGVPDAPDYRLEDILERQFEHVSLETVLERALRNRADLRALDLRKQSLDEALKAAKAGHYPHLDGVALYRWIGEEHPLDREWQVGAAVTLPLFTGLRTRHEVLEARANRKAEEAREDALKQAIILEAQHAWLNLHEAQERIGTARLAVRQASENFDIAQGRYRTGVGNPIEVTDAQVAYADARNMLTGALYDYQIAVAALERVMGKK
ncbi:MAG: TolC family protein [Deltaproteobacteria bacterium]|nr:TolC family protein [Deltaproteobacteria bacterium]